MAQYFKRIPDEFNHKQQKAMVVDGLIQQIIIYPIYYLLPLWKRAKSPPPGVRWGCFRRYWKISHDKVFANILDDLNSSWPLGTACV